MAAIVTAEDFTKAINGLTRQGQLTVITGHERFLDRNNRKLFDDQHDISGARISHVDITPDTLTLEAGLDFELAFQAAKQQQQSAKADILTLADTAKQHAQKIADIFAPVVNADFNGETTDTRFTNIRAAVALQGAGFQTLFHTAMEADTGLTTAILDATPTAIQKQAYNAFVRAFCNTWVQMISLAVK